LIGLAGAAPLVRAGGSAENAVLLINPSHLESMNVGAYYKNARNIPDSNVFYVDPVVADYATFAATNGVLDGFLGFLANARIDDHTDFVVITPGNSFFISAPGYIKDTCFTVTRFSIASAFTTAFMRSEILTLPKESSQLTNEYYATGNAATAFDSNTSWLGGVASNDPNAQRYYIAGLLGFTGAGGNSIAEITAMIDRSVAVDGTRPGGTFYFMNNTADSIRNVRQPQFSGAITQITNNGGAALQVNGTLPIGHQDCLGIMSGFASEPNIETGNYTILPGAFGDHLTSFGATFDGGAQTRVSSWIRKGASASFGTVEEPCNYTGKFPNAKIHSRYFAGMSLAEACLRSLQFVPFQGLFYGDPMTRAFTHIPDVSATGPRSTVSGYVTITPSGTTAHPTASIASFDLLVDGVLRGSTTPGGSFVLDTTLLDDGWHDLRVLGYDDTVAASSGRFVSSMVTDNWGHSATLSLPLPSQNLSRVYQFDVAASGGTPVETRILINNRVVGAGAGTGVISARGWALGPGTHQAQAEVTFADGRRARSPRVPITVGYWADPASGAAPIAFDYTKHVRNDVPALVELPASYDSNPSGAVYAVTSGPAGATIGTSTTRGFRVITPVGNPCGTDSLTFTVTTAEGTSNTGTVTLVYDPPLGSCPADFDGNGFVNGDDFDAFAQEFIDGTPAADFNNDCFTNGDDFDLFAERFERGC